MEKNKLGIAVQTITGAFTIAASDPPIVALSAAAPQDVTLPAVEKGLIFWVIAAGAQALTVKNAGASTIGVVAAGSIGYFVSDGTSWYCWTSGVLSAASLTLTGNLVVQGNTDLGNAVSDTIGFYGSTKVAQPASASQAVTAVTLVTAVALTLVTAVAITAATAAGTTAPTKTTTTYGYTTSTQAAKIVSLLNQLKVDVATIKARVDQGKVDLATVKARVDQAKVDLAAHNVLLTAVRAALVPTTGLGLMKGAA
jgi:hypothetical protein